MCIPEFTPEVCILEFTPEVCIPEFTSEILNDFRGVFSRMFPLYSSASCTTILHRDGSSWFEAAAEEQAGTTNGRTSPAAH